MKRNSLLQKRQKLSGEKRVKIALELSRLVRKVYNEGKLAREKNNGKKLKVEKYFNELGKINLENYL